jgi:hypothetical protein
MAPLVQALFPRPERLAALADAACANSAVVNLLRVTNDDLVPRVALAAGVLTELDMEPVRVRGEDSQATGAHDETATRSPGHRGLVNWSTPTVVSPPAVTARTSFRRRCR